MAHLSHRACQSGCSLCRAPGIAPLLACALAASSTRDCSVSGLNVEGKPLSAHQTLPIWLQPVRALHDARDGAGPGWGDLTISSRLHLPS